jgi:hypothetical protein
MCQNIVDQRSAIADCRLRIVKLELTIVNFRLSIAAVFKDTNSPAWMRQSAICIPHSAIRNPQSASFYLSVIP